MKTTLKELLKSKKLKNQLQVGDKATFSLYTGEKVVAEVIGLNHDVLANGKGVARATFRFTIDGEYNMNDDWTNVGGWEKSKMRTVYCKRLFKLLPIELQKAIKTVIKETTKGGGSKEIVKTKDKLFLLSLTEAVGGSIWSSYVEEGKQYELFKKKGYSFNKWSWLRSPNIDGTNYFMCVTSNGSELNSGAVSTYGVCFAFSI